MSRTLSVRNRQRVRRVNTPLLRRITLQLLDEQLHIDDFQLAVHLVAAPEMVKVNWNYLQHEGSTDVITFDHNQPVEASARRLSNRKSATPQRPESPHANSCGSLHGELFVCLDDAAKQARQFHTTWQNELARYVNHGLLHLCGQDDIKPAARRKMKREEERLLRLIAGDFDLSKLETRNPKRGPGRAPRSAI